VPLDGFQPAKILGPNGYWQDEDMDIDTRRKLIIGALDPRHDDVDPAACPGIGTLGEEPQPQLRQRLLRHLLRGCRFIWTGGPARRDDLPALFPGVWTAFAPGARGDGRPIWVTDLRNPHKPKVYDQPD
jgi:hypothetical protein